MISQPQCSLLAYMKYGALPEAGCMPVRKSALLGSPCNVGYLQATIFVYDNKPCQVMRYCNFVFLLTVQKI